MCNDRPPRLGLGRRQAGGAAPPPAPRKNHYAFATFSALKYSVARLQSEQGQYRRRPSPSWNLWRPSHPTTGAPSNKGGMSAMLPCATYSKIARQLCPTDFLAHMPSHTRPSLDEIRELATESAHRHNRHRRAASCAQTDQITGNQDHQIKRPCSSFAQRRTHPYRLPDAHEALRHAAMSLQHTSSPRHSQNTQPPRTALLVDRYERQHTVLDTQLPQVPSSQNVTTRGPLTHHHLTSAHRSRHRCRRGLLRTPSDHSRRQFPHNTLH